jgi:hypothetical protein
MYDIGDKMIITLGDIHGRFNLLQTNITNLNLSDCVIIQVGDFGVGFDNLKNDLQTLTVLNKFLSDRDIQLFVIRGNHDGPTFFTGDKYFFSNIFLLKDYSTISYGSEGKKILCVGGAISVDRGNDSEGPWQGRVEGFDYWKDENFVLDEAKLKVMSDVDIVLTHSAPDFCFPHGVTGTQKWINSNPELYFELIKEREDLTKMYNILSENNKIRQWCYGHFHSGKRDEYLDTKFVLLSIDEFYEIR